LLDIGKSEFFAQCSHLSSADKARAEGIWDELEKASQVFYEREGKIPGSFEAKFSAKADSSGKQVVIHKGIENRTNDMFPFKYFNNKEFIEFMDIVFKRNNAPNSLYALQSKNKQK